MFIEKDQYGSGPNGSICARCDLIIPPGKEVTVELSDTNSSSELELDELKKDLYHPECAKTLQQLARAYDIPVRGFGF